MQCEVKVAQAALRVAKSAAGMRSPLKAYGAVKVTGADGIATMEAMDGCIGVRRVFDATDVDGLLALVPITKLEKTLSVMKGEVTFTQGEGSGLIVSAGSRKVAIPGERFEDLPPLTFTGGDVILREDGSTLADIIGRVAPYASPDEKRPVLTGVSVDSSGSLVGCDSYRLGVFPVMGIDCAAVERVADGPSVNVPARAWTLAAKGMKGASVTVSVSGVWAILDAGEAVWTARIIAGTYPKWQQLMPDTFEVTAVLDDVSALQCSAEAARKLLDPKSAMRIGLNGGINVRAFEPDGVDMSETVPATITYETACAAEWTGTDDRPVEFGCNPDFLADALKSLAGGPVSLRMVSPLKPALLEGEVGRSLLMPIRVSV